MTPLDEYRRKRDFAATPEPAGGETETRPQSGLSYVIQKHAASRLHWDFRIELDGVMLSWAVPKGPSLDPSEKRLAMRVEDHPIEYGSFEGNIPKGEYGGGTVMLWDRGTWEPDHGDPREHLEQGHLKFYLYGERLRGRWMLVKTKGYGKGGKPQQNSWLLFKERDEEVRPKEAFSAVEEWQTSVATGRTMEQIAEDTDAVWHSSADLAENVATTTGIQPPPSDAASPPLSLGEIEGARPATMPDPDDFEVELATLVKSVPEGDRWFHEIKFDGYRILAYLDHGDVKLISRNHKDWTERFRPVADAVAALPAQQAVLDGEVVVMDKNGRSDFQALQNFVLGGDGASLNYMLFDLVHLDGYDLTDVPLERRKELLAPLLPRHDDRLRLSDHVDGRGDTFFEHACEMRLEGVVSKRRDAPYRGGRGHSWVKTKCLQQQEFVVVGYTDPSGSRKGFGALVLAVGEGGRYRLAGRVGTGFSDALLADILSRLEPLQRTDPPVSDPPTGADARAIHWVEPRLVVEVSFAEWTREGSLRHPSFVGIREDKTPDEVTAEKPAPLPVPPLEGSEPAPGNAPGRVATAGKSGRVEFAGVSLSNPDRVLWPDTGITKIELARYYETVAEQMLPHVADRPLSLVRCPAGYTGECFYQKHIKDFPVTVGTVDVYEPGEGTTAPYARIDDVSGLVGLAQMGVLEIHPWGSRADDIDKPDRIVFDLDPDEGHPWSQVAATALLLRSELDRLGLQSWLKSTGGKGLHVVVPVLRRHSWEQVRDFAHTFAESIVAIEPRAFTTSMRKADRVGKIFIDYVRNTRGATSIGAYSPRARPGAPIAVPLHWDEVEQGAERPEYCVRDIGERLAELAADPWADLPKARQSLTRDALSRLGL